jgi:outer membrane murein-binding lipoprotein Lpp
MENTELLQAFKTIISQEMNDFKKEVNQRFDKLETKVDNLEIKVDKLETKVDKLEQGQKEIKEMMLKNDLVIANFATDINEYVDKKIRETETSILSKLNEMETVTADNCYNISLLKQKLKMA